MVSIYVHMVMTDQGRGGRGRKEFLEKRKRGKPKKKFAGETQLPTDKQKNREADR